MNIKRLSLLIVIAITSMTTKIFSRIHAIDLVAKRLQNGKIHCVWGLRDHHEGHQKKRNKTIIRQQRKHISRFAQKVNATVLVEDPYEYIPDSNHPVFMIPKRHHGFTRKNKISLLRGLTNELSEEGIASYNIERRQNIKLAKKARRNTCNPIFYLGIIGMFDCIFGCACPLPVIMKTLLLIKTIPIALSSINGICYFNGHLAHNKTVQTIEENIENSKYRDILTDIKNRFLKKDLKGKYKPHQHNWLNDMVTIMQLLKQSENEDENVKFIHSFVVGGGYHITRILDVFEDEFTYKDIFAKRAKFKRDYTQHLNIKRVINDLLQEDESESSQEDEFKDEFENEGEDEFEDESKKILQSVLEELFPSKDLAENIRRRKISEDDSSDEEEYLENDQLFREIKQHLRKAYGDEEEDKEENECGEEAEEIDDEREEEGEVEILARQTEEEIDDDEYEDDQEVTARRRNKTQIRDARN